jgi:8-oxo-dGTP pyrophosphatase MutT (NUDIX family)
VTSEEREAELPDPIPAATLVLMRARPHGPPDILFIERTATMAFAAGALVFPGGRIDPADRDLATRFPGLGDAAARIAAIRETIEETGIAPALRGPVPRERLAELRSELDRGIAFDALIDRHGLALDLAALTPLARWCPTFKEARRFDTLFFLAAAPPESEPSFAAAEATRAFWAPAAQVLADIKAGEAKAIFPTRRNLERLARFGSIEEARADAARHPVRKVVPWIEERNGERWLCIPGDLGYPVTAERLDTARRF